MDGVVSEHFSNLFLIPSHCIIHWLHPITSIIHYNIFFSNIDSAEIEHPHFSFLGRSYFVETQLDYGS